MAEVKVTVKLELHGKTLKASKKHVRLNDDDVQIAASNLGYSLVEEAWGIEAAAEEAELSEGSVP